MIDEIKEGFGVCEYCKKEYFAIKVRYPMKDIAHEIPCPSCGKSVGWVPKGTEDFELQSRDSIEKKQREEALKPNCPICGMKMVKRKGYSEFWGCQNYPNCFGTIKIESDLDI